MWMRGEEEKVDQQHEILPFADGTWYLRVTLDVPAEEATGLSCRVKHSSLGNRDIVLFWGEKEPGPGCENVTESLPKSRSTGKG